MDKVFSWLFSGRGLTPHGICLSWRPELIWLNVGSDAIIALCYFSIPVALAAFAVRRRDIAFRWVFWCFAAFITACGATHLMSIWTLWIPDYDAEAVLKGVTAAASIWTATALWVLFPAALQAPSAAQLLQANLDLSARVRERDEAMAALVERNRLLVLAEEMAQAGHWRIELPGHRRVWSDGIHRIFGVDPADGPPALLDAANGYHPEDRDRVIAVLEDSLQNGEPFSLETKIQRPSGEERIIVVRGVCERVAGQAPTSLFGVSLDVTDAKRSEEALRLRERQLRAVLDNMPALIGCWDRDLRNVLANRTYSAWYAIDHLALESRDLRDVIGEAAFALNRPYIEGALRGEPQRFERRIPRPDGGERHTLAAYVPDVREDGRVEGFFALVTDITDLKLAEARLRDSEAFLDRVGRVAKTGGWEVDLRTGEVRWSEHTRRIHEVEDDFVPTFDSAAAFYEGEARETMRVAYACSLEEGTPYDLELPLRTAKGRSIWVRASGETEFVDGRAVRVFGALRDVTERKVAEAEKEATRLIVEEARAAAEKARAEAEAASLAKSEFLATMSHEIRTPLNAVIGYSDRILESEGLADLDRRSAEIVKSSGEALLTIVNDVLDFSRIEAGKLELRPVPFELERLIEDAMAMVADAAQRKRLDLRRERRSPLPDFVLGDADRLRQVLLNLLNNAVKFTQEGSIVLTCEPTADGGSVRFEVEDQGIGIAPDRTDLLFQRFTQVDGTISRRFGGSGLGLAISKALVTLMAGDIGVTSVEGKGSTFWFEVPLPTAQRQRDEARSPAIASTHAGRILVVEDVAINRELARAVVSSGGFEVDVASDGEEAVSLAGSRDYDLILMDVQMPGMDGLTAARRIAEHEGPRRAVPILGMTANVLPAQVAALRAAGMVGHIGKPFRKPELLAAVAQAMAATADHQPERRPTSEVSLV